MSNRKPIGTKLRHAILNRDRYTCQYCGAKSPDSTLEVDHLIPVYRGGDNCLLNLVTSCWACNSGKSSQSPSPEMIGVTLLRIKNLSDFVLSKSLSYWAKASKNGCWEPTTAFRIVKAYALSELGPLHDDVEWFMPKEEIKWSSLVKETSGSINSPANKVGATDIHRYLYFNMMMVDMKRSGHLEIRGTKEDNYEFIRMSWRWLL